MLVYFYSLKVRSKFNFCAIINVIKINSCNYQSPEWKTITISLFKKLRKTDQKGIKELINNNSITVKKKNTKTVI